VTSISVEKGGSPPTTPAPNAYAKRSALEATAWDPTAESIFLANRKLACNRLDANH
jgi:hypothetical protein